MWQYNYNCLCHYGVKGQKWGVRRGPPYPLDKELTSSERKVKVSKVMSEHSSTPKIFEPNGVVDRLNYKGEVGTRSFYGEDAWKWKDIHTTPHGNKKEHNYGEHGEHVVEYFWNKDSGGLRFKTHRELTEAERKENDDIL